MQLLVLKNVFFFNCKRIIIIINLLVSGLHKIHIISNTVFHSARNLQGEGVDVVVVRIELEKYEAGRRGRVWIWSRKGGEGE